MSPLRLDKLSSRAAIRLTNRKVSAILGVEKSTQARRRSLVWRVSSCLRKVLTGGAVAPLYPNPLLTRGIRARRPVSQFRATT